MNFLCLFKHDWELIKIVDKNILKRNIDISDVREDTVIDVKHPAERYITKYKMVCLRCTKIGNKIISYKDRQERAKEIVAKLLMDGELK